ncbi:PREDICTED: protein FAM151A isoform X2 [Nanorana parkeri]|uniref:protein FAM151A isoform X2 n=1 Tax=Nanorana parkeri TaxID=125878 RepID=UPI00085424DA|nr:PREDICTED: protein FAM151A isoform X2 [Nanorana parkeri]
MKRCSLADLRTIAGVCVFLGVCVTIAALCLTLGKPPKKASESKPVFSTGGDMLDYLKSIGQISAKDGLQVSWYHAANNKSEMQEALNSGILVLEADVNVQGHGTVNETNIPIMAHPPDVYSDNTLQEWLDSVLLSSKGIKLDFKSIQAVSPSLDILLKKSSEMNINRPVWMNADIVPGPNVNHELGVNATQFLRLIQEKFPDITISPGWVTLYLPPIITNRTYTREMIVRMYDLVKGLPQRITFPARAVLTRSAWPHFDWLLQQSDRYTLTLWQGKSDPLTLEDLLFIRDNSDPEKIYYDIYEPLLSEFKQIAMSTNRKKLFYSGGSLRMYFHPEDDDGILVQWFDAEGDLSSVRSLLQNSFGMLTFQVDVQSSTLTPVAVVAQSSSTLLLEDCLKLVAAAANPWGVYLKPKDHVSLNETLHLLNRLNSDKLLYVPVWISMELSYGSFTTPGYIKGEDFINSINNIFPAVTIAPRWPPEKLDNGYTDQMVQDMLKLFDGVWQDVSFQLQAVALGKAWLSTVHLLKASPTYTLTVEHTKDQGAFMEGYHGLVTIRTHTTNGVYYKLPPDYRSSLMTSIYST